MKNIHITIALEELISDLKYLATKTKNSKQFYNACSTLNLEHHIRNMEGILQVQEDMESITLAAAKARAVLATAAAKAVKITLKAAAAASALIVSAETEARIRTNSLAETRN